MLQYKVSPISAKNLYPHNDSDAPKDGPCVVKAGKNHTSCNALDTWNGPIVDTTAVDGKFHMFNPLYKKGSLFATQDMMYGTATKITGPYDWRSLGMGNIGSNPAFVSYTEGGKPKYAFFANGVFLADHVFGPYTKLKGCGGPGGNPAPIYHGGAWYGTAQGTSEILTTPALVENCKWTKFATIQPKLKKGTQEDPCGCPCSVLLFRTHAGAQCVTRVCCPAFLCCPLQVHVGRQERELAHH